MLVAEKSISACTPQLHGVLLDARSKTEPMVKHEVWSVSRDQIFACFWIDYPDAGLILVSDHERPNGQEENLTDQQFRTPPTPPAMLGLLPLPKPSAKASAGSTGRVDIVSADLD